MRKKIMFMSNGNTIVFDEQGEQIPALQKSWFRSYVADMLLFGYDPKEFTFLVPDGNQFVPIMEDKPDYPYKMANWKVWPYDGEHNPGNRHVL